MMAISLDFLLSLTLLVAGLGGCRRLIGLHNSLHFLSDIFDVSVLRTSSALLGASEDLVAFLTFSSIHCAFPIPALISFPCCILIAFGVLPNSLAIMVKVEPSSAMRMMIEFSSSV